MWMFPSGGGYFIIITFIASVSQCVRVCIHSFLLSCLRQALNVNPFHHIPDTTVLVRSHLQHASTLISMARLRWLGHIYRMEDNRLPKQILFGEIASAKRPQHKPKLRWRDCVSKDLSLCNADVHYHLMWSTFEP